MKDFERYIRENKQHFYQEQLSEGHEARFLQKLKSEKPFVKRNSWRKVLFRVAVVALLTLGGAGVLHFGINQNMQRIAVKLPKEVSEAENYYLAKCEEELSYFKTHHSSTSPIDIATELENLEKEYKELKKKMVTQQGNKRVMAALVQNLQLRLQLLEQINRLMEKEEPQTVEI